MASLFDKVLGSSLIPGSEFLGKKKTFDPLGLIKSSPKKPKKTPQELAIEKRQRSLLDKEIGKQEDRFKLLNRGKLGRQSLLSGAARTTTEAAGGTRRGGGVGVRSLLPGAGRPGASIPGRPSKSSATRVRN